MPQQMKSDVISEETFDTKLITTTQAFALTGRLADCHYTQGDALG